MQVQIEQKGDETHLIVPSDVKEAHVIRHGDNRKMLVVSEKGFGKRTPLNEYRNVKRAGKGMPTMNITKKTGSIAGALIVTDDQDVMIITHQGQMIRTPVRNISVSGRKTQGVKLINLDSGDHVTGVTSVVMDEENPS